ncbi:MAG: peptidase MA family metallohydrolase [Thermodesulfovibrionales bacterium]|nr:peptidase MA family metallohydrolase [Thermodesulfovibrionales bacterium]
MIILRTAVYITLSILLMAVAYNYFRHKDIPAPASETQTAQSNTGVKAAHSEAGIGKIDAAPAAVEEISAEENAMPEAAVPRNGPKAEVIESYNRGDFTKAIELFGRLPYDDKVPLLALAGVSYYKTGDMDTAMRHFEDSLRYEDSFIARKFLAFVYYGKSDLQKSLSSAEKALSMKKDTELLSLYERVKTEISTQGSYLEESVLHFKILFDGYEHGGLSRKVLGMLEDAYNRIGSEMSHYPSEQITVVLHTKKAFFDITRVPEWSGGLYDGKIRIPVAGAENNERLLRRVVFHEYTHALIHQTTKSCPLWVNEGLAEYFSDGREKTGQVIPLRELEKSFMNLNKGMAEKAYAESYSAVAYLIEKYGFYSMKRLLLALGEGKDINEAFLNAFYISYDEFVSTWGKP